VTRVPWTAERQAVWESSYLQSRSQIGVGFSKSWAYELTAAGLFDVVPAMAKPVVATTPFTSLDDLARELQITRTAPRIRLPGSSGWRPQSPTLDCGLRRVPARPSLSR
jgi:hypothetical protein